MTFYSQVCYSVHKVWNWICTNWGFFLLASWAFFSTALVFSAILYLLASFFGILTAGAFSLLFGVLCFGLYRRSVLFYKKISVSFLIEKDSAMLLRQIDARTFLKLKLSRWKRIQVWYRKYWIK